MKTIKWPFLSEITANRSAESLARFDSLVELLLLLEMASVYSNFVV